jgi:hypothetical protein
LPENDLTPQILTLVAALFAAIMSLISLLLNARLTLLREKRMLLWQKELDRILELEEAAGVAKEIALSYSSPSVLEAEFPPYHDKIRHAAGQFGRYPDLAQAIRDLNHACAITVSEKISRGDSREWQAKINPAYKEFLRQCDEITERQKT